MSLSARQKSTKNILIQAQKQKHRLKLSQLITQPTVNQFSISYPNLAQKYNTQHTKKHEFSQKITSMQTKYYDQSLIYMENEIDFNDHREYLKRYYLWEEFDGKIRMLGEYYKYHHDHPRIFIEDVEKIMTTYQEQQRELQYVRVRQKIQEERQINQENLNLDPMKNVDLRKNLQQKELNKCKKSQKILKNIQLSYIDFEKKPEKKPKAQNLPEPNQQIKRKTSTPCALNSKQKTLHKSGSMNIKNMFSSISQHQKSRETSRNDTKKVFPLKQAESKELKKFQSKYTQIISQMFKKKRSSSKNCIIDHQIEHKIDKNINLIVKQRQIQVPPSNKVHQQASDLSSTKLNQDNKHKQIKKMMRSKSHATMNVCKSSKLLKTFKAKINQKAVILNSKPISHFSSKQASKHKHDENTIEQTLKRQKYSSNKSLRQQNTNINHKPVKTVKIFEITKKDFAIEHASKSSNVQKDESKVNSKQQIHEKVKFENKENNENQNNQIPIEKDKKRPSTFKPSILFNSVNKKKQTIKKQQKQYKIYAKRYGI